MPAEVTRGLLDTNIVILRHGIDPDDLPDEMAISAVTPAELSAGVHLVDSTRADAIAERARRADVLARRKTNSIRSRSRRSQHGRSDASALRWRPSAEHPDDATPT